MNYILTADVGGTKIATALLNEAGVVYAQKILPSLTENAETMYEQLLLAFQYVMNEAGVVEKEVCFIGVGLPGKVDVIRGMAIFQNNLPWRDFPLVSRLQTNFPTSEITIDNDVYMAAKGEWFAHQLKNELMAFVTISTGISACFIQKGEVIRGAGMAGEIGLTYVGCDEKETLEEKASGTSLTKKSVNRLNLQSKDAVKQLMDSFLQGDPLAKEIVTHMTRDMAKGLHQIFCVLDPDIIVLGGGVVNHQPWLLDFIKKELQKLVVNPVQSGIEKRLRVSKLKEEAGLLGASIAVNVRKTGAINKK
ncbi:ROK family protein [Alkalihalobacillus sp. 1P02AB]|uniref:ROK family protein n=1 Tax=Alkalihalobacillus sp. 1P02AB TaxID=3132260 RepID=UPI0039A66C73